MTRHSIALLGFMLTLRLAALGTMAGDVVTTKAVLNLGGYESNPTMGSQPSMVKLAALDGGTLGAIYGLERSHPRIAKALYITVIATRGWAVTHNARQLR